MLRRVINIYFSLMKDEDNINNKDCDMHDIFEHDEQQQKFEKKLE